MTGTLIDIDADTPRVGAALAVLSNRLADLRDPLAEIGELMVDSTFHRIGAGGPAPDGSPWAPLAPSTLARKKGPGPLRENLTLQGSFRYQVEGDAVVWGTNLVYAAAQQFGLPARTIRPKRGKALAWPGAKHPVAKVNHPGLKPRPFLGVSIDDEGLIMEVVQDYLGQP